MKIDLKIDGVTLTEKEKIRFKELYDSIYYYLNMENVKGSYKNDILAYNIVALTFDTEGKHKKDSKDL